MNQEVAYGDYDEDLQMKVTFYLKKLKK